MRWDDHRLLASGTRHEIGAPRDWVRAIAVNPEKATINRAMVGRPRRRDCADEFHEALGQDPLAVPEAILKVEIAKPRPVARGGEFVSLHKEVAERVGLHNHGAHAKLVEQRSPREGKIFLAALLHC